MRTAALLFAGVRADAADGGRHRNFFFDALDSLGVFAVRDQPDIALTIGIGRTRFRAGRFAVAVMIGEQQLQRHLARTHHAGRVGMYHHAVRRLGGTRAQELADALGFDHAKPARTVQLHASVIAKVGNFQSVLCRRRKQGRPLLHGQLMLVYRNGNQTHQRTSTAPKRQFSAHFPHLIQISARMVCGCLTAPSIACTGQPRAHLVQPIHFSGSIT